MTDIQDPTPDDDGLSIEMRPSDFSVPQPDRLRQWREELGLKQTTVEDLTGVPSGSISDYETGRTDARLDRVRKMVALYRVLFTFRDRHHPER